MSSLKDSFDEQGVRRELAAFVGEKDAERVLRVIAPQQLQVAKTMEGQEQYECMVRGILLRLNAVELQQPISPEDVLKTMPSEDKIRAIMQALVQGRGDPKQDFRDGQERAYHKTLLERLSTFAENLTHGGDMTHACRQALTLLQTLFHPVKINERHGIAMTNYHASVLDDVTTSVSGDLQFIINFMNMCSAFVERVRSLLHTAEVQGDSMELDTHIRNNALGFLDILQEMRKRADGFPQQCKGLIEHLKRYHHEMADVYCRGEDSGGHRGPQWRDVRMPVDPNGNVPLYKNNLHLTAFLHGIIQQIPSASDMGHKNESRSGRGKSRRGSKDLEYDKYMVKNFGDFLHGQADHLLFQNVQTPIFFQGVARVLSEIHHILQSVDQVYESSNVKGALAEGPCGMRQAYSIQLDDALKRQSIISTGTLRGSDAGKAIQAIHSIDMQRIPTSEDEASGLELQGQTAKTDEQRTILKLFDTLDEKLVSLAGGREELRGAELRDFVESLMRLKMDTRKGRRRERSRLQKDRQEGNYTYRVEGGGPFGDLHVYQVPTEPASWDEMVGSSWKDIKGRMDVIYEVARRSHIYTDLAPRRQMKNNMLIIGPPGTGKNMAVRAITADPRTVGVITRVDELMSEFVGRAEKNVGHLIDEAQVLRRKHDRPTVIAIDEIDEMFPKEGGGVVDHVKLSMQKALQAALEGHFPLDGVSLIGLTNNPEHIPAPMFRRFAHVEVVEKLEPRERKELLLKLLEGIPQTSDFEKDVDWDEILRNADFASGDVLGKIADRTYLKFIDLFDKGRPGRLDVINRRIAQLKDDGVKVTPKKKVELLRAGRGKGVMLDAFIFEHIALSTLNEDDVQQDMANQEVFYETVRRKIAEGFRGKQF